jgi:hypothetical protein
VSTKRTCLACGQEGWEEVVAMTLVDLEREEQRVVNVALAATETNRGVTGFTYLDVRERYVPEPRCRDRRACAGRVKALEPVAEPAAAEAQEVQSWLL